MTTGTVHALRHVSESLRHNPLGDPFERDVHVYTPPGWDQDTPLPATMALAAFTSTGFGFLNRKWRALSLPERMDQLIADGMPPMLVVMPDPITCLGGSQYLDSTGIGRYQTWITEELPAWIEDRFPTTGAWGAVGKSSGGYGALAMAMMRPGTYKAIAAHSPDAGFEYCYPPDFPGALETIRTAGGLELWWKAFRQGRDLSGSDHAVINLLGMACAYSPDPAATPLPCELPVDFDTGALRPEVMEKLLAFDPVRMVPRCREALLGLEGLWLDVGRRDEFRLQVGARLLHQALEGAGILHEFQEHDGGHFKLNDRLSQSLPFLAERLSAGSID